MKLFQSGIKLVQRVSASGNVQFYNHALSRLKELGPEHDDVAISYNNLGRVHHNQGNLSKARHYYNRSRATFLKELGPDHVHMATSYSNLGQVYRR